jgi:5,6-dimethylbenzimidazole synthase
VNLVADKWERGMPSDLYDVINRRRDVRAEFTGEAVADDLLHRVLSAAHAAPSVGLTQPWDFILVRDKTLRRRFQAHVQREQEIFESSPDEAKNATFRRIKIEGILESSLGIVVTYDPERGAPAVLGRHTIADTGLYSTCLAIQNLWLAATTEGRGVGWVAFYREPFLRELLDIPRQIRPIAWLCLGPVSQMRQVPGQERHGWRQRRPLAESIHYNRYRAT